MKTILALCALILLAGAFALWRHLRTPMLYGDFAGAPRASVADLVTKPKAFKGKTVAVEGIIKDQCTTMGCFFFFEEGKHVLRIDLEEVAMHAPRNRNGKPARVEGQLVPRGDGYQLWASAVEFK